MPSSQGSRKRLLERSPAKSRHEGRVVKRKANAESAQSLSGDVERRDLLDRADEVLERLKGSQSVEDSNVERHNLLDKADKILETLNAGSHWQSMEDSERDGLLDRADEVLERLGGYGNLMDDSDPINSDLLNSDLSDSELPDSDLTSLAAHSGGRSQQALSRIHVLMRAPAGPHVTVTSGEGERVYLRLKEEEEGVNDDGGTGHSGVRMEGRRIQRRHQQLLTVPFSDLKASVEEEVRYQNM